MPILRVGLACFPSLLQAPDVRPRRGEVPQPARAIVSKLASNKTVVETPRGSPADVDEWKRAKYMPPPEPELDEDALVGSTVSVLDVHGERVNAKVILSVGGGQYMVRSESMQFAADLATAMRCRESWIVSKKS